MKQTTPKLVVLTLFLTLLTVAVSILPGIIGRGRSSPSEAISPPPGNNDKTPPATEPPAPAANNYPVLSQTTVYGRLQRLGSAGQDVLCESYLISGYLYILFHSESEGYDSPRDQSLNIAKLDALGNIIKCVSLENGAAAIYLSSKPIWNGFAIDLRDKTLFVDFSLDILGSFQHAPTESSSMYFSLSSDRLCLFGISSDTLRQRSFSSELFPSAEKTAKIAPSSSIVSVVEGMNVFYVAVNSNNSFSIFSCGDTAAKLFESTGTVTHVLAYSGGYAITRKNSGSILLFSSKFVLSAERTVDGAVLSFEPASFGFVVCSKSGGGTSLTFFCPHMDFLLKKTANGELYASTVGSKTFLYSLGAFYFELFLLNDFETAGALSLPADEITSIRTAVNGENSLFILSARQISSTRSYGESGVFIVIVK